MTSHDARSQQAIDLADQVSSQMFHRFRREIPLGELKSLAQPAAITAAVHWDGRGSFPKYAVQRMRWAVIDGLRREQRLRRRPMNPSLLRRLASQCTERAADIAVVAVQSSPEPPPAAETLADLLRSAAAAFTVELDAEGALSLADEGEDVEENVERMRLRRAIADLPEAERAVVERYHYSGETFDEIAEATGVHRATVFSAYARAQEKLRRAFEETA